MPKGLDNRARRRFKGNILLPQVCARERARRGAAAVLARPAPRARHRRTRLARPPSAQAGYGTNAKTRHLLPSGFYKFVVNNVAELEMLLMQNRKYAAEIAGATGIRARKAILKRAAELNIKVTNANGKVVKGSD